MSNRTTAWLAWSLWAVCVLLIGLAFMLDFATGDVPAPSGTRAGPGLAVLAGILSLAYPTVGALIASRLPTNPIGWTFCTVGLIYAAQRFTMAYADYALLENLALPLGVYAAWFSSWVWFTQPLGLVFLLLLFPDGRLTSRRWRIVAWVALCGAALAALGDAFLPEHLTNHPYVFNPFRLMVLTGGGLTTFRTFSAAGLLGYTLLIASNLAALFSLVLRMYSTRGDERQQIKWFLYAAVPAVLSLSPLILQYMVIGFTSEFLLHTVQIMAWDVYFYLSYVGLFGLFAVPVCTYIAILRYRLYDIDRIINRTLVYGSLTLMLALVYFGVVTVTQALLQTLTGQEKLPQLAIVVSTLLIAALFTPLSRRIQGFIDRRFYRRKYDAAKTLEAFSTKLRDETDLDALSDDLVGVVRETMQPAHVSVWLRPATAPKGEQAE